MTRLYFLCLYLYADKFEDTSINPSSFPPSAGAPFDHPTTRGQLLSWWRELGHYLGLKYEPHIQSPGTHGNYYRTIWRAFCPRIEQQRDRVVNKLEIVVKSIYSHPIDKSLLCHHQPPSTSAAALEWNPSDVCTYVCMYKQEHMLGCGGGG